MNSCVSHNVQTAHNLTADIGELKSAGLHLLEIRAFSDYGMQSFTLYGRKDQIKQIIAELNRKMRSLYQPEEIPVGL